MTVSDKAGLGETIERRTCEMSLEEHIEVAMTALTLFGVGVGCETQYRALLVIVETARLLHGHGAFDPVPMARELADRAIALQQETDLARAAVACHAQSENGQVH